MIKLESAIRRNIYVLFEHKPAMCFFLSFFFCRFFLHICTRRSLFCENNNLITTGVVCAVEM